MLFKLLKFAMEHWYIILFCSACAKEACNSEQAHQRWLLMHVPASICRCHRDSCGHCLASRQVSVKKRKKQSATLQTSLEMPLVLPAAFAWKVPSVLLHWNVQPFKNNIYTVVSSPLCEWNVQPFKSNIYTVVSSSLSWVEWLCTSNLADMCMAFVSLQWQVWIYSVL